MKHNAIAYFGVVAAILSCCPADADQFRLPEEIGRIEAPRDMNLFALEPTVIDERYYTSGRAERHQFVGNVLPAGAEIPDNDAPVAVGIVKHQSSSASSSSSGSSSTTLTKPAAVAAPKATASPPK
jgi:hypothetical protein